MGMLDWLLQIGDKPANGDEGTNKATQPEDRGTEVGGLDFKSAVDAHMKWKVRLDAYINGTSTETLNVDTICRDDQCPLGKWIYSRGVTEFGYSETFFDMKAHHAHFHRCAGDVLRAAQAGEKEKALHLLHQGDYVRASERVKKLLAKLFVLVADGKTAIDAHMKWKERLRDHIAGVSDETLDSRVVTRDDLCTLGTWIVSEGEKRFAGSSAFEHLKRVHARFHAAAGNIVALAAVGRKDEAMAMLEEGEYAQASDDIAIALVDLFSQPAA
jgi:hypothetical protein